MSGVLIPVISIGVLAVGAWVLARRNRAVAVEAGPAVIAISRRTTLWRLTGVVLGTIVGVAFSFSGSLGRGAMLAAPLFSLCVLAGVLTGEATVQAPTGARRTAGLEVRRVRDYLPPRLLQAIGGATLLLLALLAVTTATAGADDLGRAGRVLAHRCDGLRLEAHGPWAGSFYSVPLAAIVGLGLLTAAITLRRLVRRPRFGSTAVELEVDEAMRHRAGRAVAGAAGLLVSIPLAGVTLVTAGNLLAISCRPTWWTTAAWSLLALVPLLLVLMAQCMVAIVARGPQLDAAPQLDTALRNA